ncbi:hypothetical protein D3C80_1446020 [compost metagenome]
MHLEQDLVALRFGAGDFFQYQGFGGAEGFAQHGFHRASPLRMMGWGLLTFGGEPRRNEASADPGSVGGEGLSVNEHGRV